MLYLSEMPDTEGKSGHIHRILPVSVPSDVESVEVAVLDDGGRHRRAGDEADREDRDSFRFPDLEEIFSWSRDQWSML